jgi:DNA-binding IclR family transcriptional regulator
LDWQGENACLHQDALPLECKEEMPVTRQPASSTDVPALDRGLSILEYVMEAKHPVSMREASQALSIPSASAFRLIRNLVQRGYLEEIDTSQLFYLPGNKLFQMVQFYQMNHSLHTSARLPLQELAARTGQTAQLAILQGDAIVYIDQAIPKEPVSIIASLHAPVPINVSAAGKIICAQLPEDELNRIVSEITLIQKTPQTAITAQALLEEISVSRKNGYGTDMEEFARGIGCVAAPIWDLSNHCIGAIGITGNIEHYHNGKTFKENVTAVLEAAREVSLTMGHQPWHS